MFLVSAGLFAAAGLRTRDPLVVAGSVVFGVACLLFLTPTTPASVTQQQDGRSG